MDNMSRLEQIVARLPEATDQATEHLSLKLPLAEAEAVVADRRPRVCRRLRPRTARVGRTHRAP